MTRAGSALSRLGACRLYGILDLGYLPAEAAPAAARGMVAGGIDIVQLRAKNVPSDQVLACARQVQPIFAEAGVPFILNDHPALIDAAKADGVHVGQDDCPVPDARSIGGSGIIVGKSTHSPDQAAAAEEEGADYIGFGPLFPTPTKPGRPAIGLDGIRRVHELVRIPVFCIGGVKLGNLADVIAAGARRVVIVSGILQAADIPAYCRDARALLPPV